MKEFKAYAFAKKRHEGQFRKFGENRPYIEHPKRVAQMVRLYSNDEDLIKAAYLHDTLEDTDTNYNELVSYFGSKCANFVLELTNDENEKSKLGKKEYLTKKMNIISEKALIAKFADRIDNVRDLANADSAFASRYVYDTEYILENLNRDLNDTHNILKEILKDAIKNVKRRFSL